MKSFFMVYGDYPDLKHVRHILIIKMRHLGDVLLAEPVFSYLKKKLPNAEIDAYIWKEAYLMLEGNPAISGFYLYERSWKKLNFFKRMRCEWKILREIRKKKYDLVINLTEGDRGAIAAYLSGSKIRVGFDPENQGLFGKKSFYSHIVKPCKNPRHSVEKNLDALRCIGLFPKFDERSLFFHIPDAAKQKVKKWLEKDDFVVVHAPSRWRFKCLPVQLMAQLVDLIEAPVVLSGGPAEIERDMVDQICRLARSKPINFAGKTTLKEFGALLLLSRGLITVDSVALHLGSALQVPLVALFGPTSEQNWGPWKHEKSQVISKRISCRPCLLDGCGGSKMSDCLATLSAYEIAGAFSLLSGVKVSAEATRSAARLFSLNSLEMKKTE